MMKECRSPNDKISPRSPRVASELVIRHLSSVRHSLICHSAFLLLFVPAALEAADNIGVLGSTPKWSVLERYQETITRDEFAHLINDVYCTHRFAPDLIEINEKRARVLMNRETQKFFTLRFAENPATAGRQPVPRLWRPARSLPPLRPEKPLFGLKIGLDPAHLGGKWATMED